MKLLAALLILTFALAATGDTPAAAVPRPNFTEIESPAERMEAKLDYMADNGRAEKPDQQPIELSPDEVEAYFAAGKVKLPAGVTRIRYTSTPGVITATTRVDFDQVTASRRSNNPLLALFTGVHDVEVVAKAAGSGGVARVDIQSVTMDGVKIPRMALEFFVDRYVKPKYPKVGLNNEFKMPARVDTAEFGKDVLTLTQK